MNLNDIQGSEIFCSLNKNLKHKVSKNQSNASGQFTRGEKNLHIRQTGYKSMQKPWSSATKVNVIFRCIGNKKSSVQGWANFVMKSWFMNRQCCMMAVPHAQRWQYHQLVFILVNEKQHCTEDFRSLQIYLIDIIMKMQDLHSLTIVYNTFMTIPWRLRNCI